MDDVAGAPTPDTTELRPSLKVALKWEVVLRAVDSALDRLHFLATAIRRASAKRLEYNVGSFLTDEDVLFRRDAASFVKWKFPEARKTLCQQLGDSIAVRRRMLLQRNRHAKKLAVRRTPETATPATHQHNVQLSLQATDRQVNERIVHGVNLPSGAGTRASKPNPQAVVLRQIFVPARLALSSTISSSSSTPGDMFEYPNPPKVKDGEKHTPCPYCLKPLETAKLKPIDMEKLKPLEAAKPRHHHNEFWRLAIHKRNICLIFLT